MEQTKIVVIGAGVIGLTTALTLKKRGWKNVKIIAKYTPGDMAIEYTSPYAGAHWRTMAPNDNPLLQKLDAISYREFLRIAEQESKSNTGIMVVPSYDYYQDINPEFTNPWFRDLVKDFKFLKEKDELPENAKIGHTYTTVLVNSPIYLKWLENNFKGLGGVIEKRAISDLREVLHQDVDVVINCTGLGSKYIAGIQDKALFPTRGQTIVVRAPHIKRTLTHIGSHGITYIIPRSDGTVVLGGTANKNDFNPFSDADTNQDILERTKRLCPELSTAGDLEIVRYSVGLRPTREGGPRFENEIYRTESEHKVLVTHAYGHGGFGYQSSWGSAEHTVEMMERGLSKIRNAKL